MAQPRTTVRRIKFIQSENKSYTVSWLCNGLGAESAAARIEETLRNELDGHADDILQFKSTSDHGASLSLKDIADLILQGCAHEHTELDDNGATLKVQLLVKKPKAPAAPRRGGSTTTDGATSDKIKAPQHVHSDQAAMFKKFWPRITETEKVYTETDNGEKKVHWEQSVFKGQMVKPSDKERGWGPVEEAIESLMMVKHGDHPHVTPATLSRSRTQIISNLHNTPIAAFHKREAGLEVAQAAKEKKVKAEEAAADKWHQKYGGIYERRTEENPPLPPELAALLHKATSGKGLGKVELVIIEKGKPGAQAETSQQQQQQQQQGIEALGNEDDNHLEEIEEDGGMVLSVPSPRQQQDTGAEALTPDQEFLVLGSCFEASEQDRKQQQEPKTSGSATAKSAAPAAAEQQPQHVQRRAQRLAAKAEARADANAMSAATEHGRSSTPKKQLNARAQQALDELMQQMSDGGLSPGMLAMMMGSKPGIREALSNHQSASMQQLRMGVDGRTLPQAETAEQRDRRLKGDRSAEVKVAKQLKGNKDKTAAVAGDGRSAGAATKGKIARKAAGGVGTGSGSNGAGRGKGKKGRGGGGGQNGGGGGRKRRAQEMEEEESEDEEEILADAEMGLSDEE